MKTSNVGRNDPCPCGSGLKYKNCCAGKAPWYTKSKWTGVLGLLIVLGGALLIWLALVRPDSSAGPAGAAPPGQVWSPEHGHYHTVP